MLSFKEKRDLQKVISQQNAILAGSPSFTEKRAAQKAKRDALDKLGITSTTSEVAAPIQQENLVDNSRFGLQASGIKTREKINTQVKAITDQIRAGKDPATLTPDEINLLKQYSGKGGLTINSQHEYYTPTHVAQGVWDALKINGFENGNVLEPSTGAGVFLATKPEGVIATGTEIDETSATVAQVLNPNDKVSNSSFELLAVNADDNSFDAVIGNVPFGNARGAAAHDDPAYKSEKLIERYFVQRVIDKVKPGGLICLIVPINIISAKGETWEKFRIAISKKAEFLGGHKLPSKTFGKQGTDVVVDVLVMRKHGAEFLSRVDDLSFDSLTGANVIWAEFVEGRYWQGEGKKFIKGEFVPKDPAKFRDSDKVIAGENMTDEALKRSLAVKFDSRIDWALLDEAAPIVRNYSEGDTKSINGMDYTLKDGQWQKVVYDIQKTELDTGMYGVSSIEELQGLLSSDVGVLSLSWGNIAATISAFPNLVPMHVKDALRFSEEQPPEHQWRAFRGVVIGAKIEGYLNNGGDTSELEELKEVILHEVVTYGHPKDISGGLFLAGNEAKRLGMFINSIDAEGNFSALIETGQLKTEAEDFNSKDVTSIIAYLFERNQDPVELETILSMYEGDTRLEDLGDISEIPGMAVSPDGFIWPFEQYCSGDVYPKMRAMRDAMLDEKDKRLVNAYKRQIERMDAKLNKTSTENINFNMRHKWFDAKYVLEFLQNNGYGRTISYNEELKQWKATGVTGGVVKQIVNYLNNEPIAGGVKAAEYKDNIRTLEEQFNAFMQAHAESEELTQQFNEAFNSFVPFDYSASSLELKNVNGKIDPHGYQNEGVRRFSREGVGILGFDVGLGKAQPLDAKILTPSGWVLMGDIKVGDFVVAYDGNHVPVTGVFPQGEKEIFEVEFSDGYKTKCCDEHLWFTKTEKDRKNERYHKRNGNNLAFSGSVKRLSEIRKTLIYQTQKNHEIPLVNATNFKSVDFVIAPYLMGVLLGDGCFKSCGITFTPGDDEIAKYAEEIIIESGLNVSVKKVNFSDTDKANCYSISLGNIGGGNINPVKAELRKLLLDGLGSHEKFIPDAYLFGSIKQRTELLRGLMDTDGYVSKDGITVQFSSTSKNLADGVVHLVQSLSGIAWMSSKIPTYTHNDEKREGRKSYTVSIRMPTEINPFRLQRKADKVLPKTKYKPVRFFTAVRSVGFEPAQCISIDHPSHLYVTDNFIVTHNTFSALALQAYNEQMGRAKRTCITVPDSVLANWYHEHKIFYKDTSNMLFVGVSPKKDKDGNIVQERVLDEKGNPKQDKNGQDLYQDVLSKDDRETIWNKMHSIPSSSFSLVVMTHPQFGKIPVRPKTKLEYADDMMSRELLSQSEADKLMSDNKLTYEQAKQKDRLEGKYSDEGTVKQDAYPFFEDMAFDSVIVDEAHYFKSSFTPGKESSRIAYLPTPTPSQRAIDMSLKMAHIRNVNGGKGPILLSATPVTNSPLEIYNMLSLMIPMEEFERFGVYTPDDFIRVFGRVEQIEKMKVSGDFGSVDAMVGFQNLDGLRSLFHKYAIIKNAEDVKLPLPDAEEVEATVELSDEQQAIYQELRTEAKKASSPDAKIRGSARPLFSIIRDMDRTTTDLDLYHKQITFVFDKAHNEALQKAIAMLPKTVQRSEYDSDLEKNVTVTVDFEYEVEEKDGKIIVRMTDAGEDDMVSAIRKVGIPENEVAHPITPKYAELVKNLKAELEVGGKQIIFTEEKTQHNKLARILVHFLPITLENIGIINADAAAGEKLQRISDAYNSGKIVIVIANKKAEVGVNLQKGTTAIHHLTFPWVPASMQQRNGRGVRQGNTVEKVRIYHYIGKGSFDMFRLNLINQKGNWINDILSGSESAVENKGDGHMSTEDIMALLSDNPEEYRARIQEQKAKREAKKKEKSEKAMVISLKQLSEARKKLGLLQGWKDDEHKKLTEDLTKNNEAINAFNDDGSEESKTKLLGLKNRVANIARKLDTLDSKYQAIEDATTATIKQKTVFLKAKEASGELPFEASAIDNPETVLISNEGVVIGVGKVFEFECEMVRYTSSRLQGLCLIKELDFKEKIITVRQKNRDYDDKLKITDLTSYKLVSVAMSKDDFDIAAMLSKPMNLPRLAEVGKETFDKHRQYILFERGLSYIAYIDGEYGVLTLGYGSDNKIPDDFVFPDVNNEAIKQAVAKHYFNGNKSYTFERDVLTLFFGSDWKTVINQYANITNEEDALSKADYEINKMADVKNVTAIEFVGQFGYTGSLADSITGLINGDNKFQIREWVLKILNDYKSKYVEQERAKQAAEEQEKLKSDPSYKEIPSDLLAKLKSVGITAKYNPSSLRTRALNPSFSLVLFQDANGKNGLLYKAKEDLKSYYGAQFGNDLGQGFNGAWWYMSASKDINKIIATILGEQQADAKIKPDKLIVPVGKVKVGQEVSGYTVTNLGKSWEAKDYHISKVKADSGFDIEEGDLIQYARFD